MLSMRIWKRRGATLQELHAETQAISRAVAALIEAADTLAQALRALLRHETEKSPSIFRTMLVGITAALAVAGIGYSTNLIANSHQSAGSAASLRQEADVKEIQATSSYSNHRTASSSGAFE